MDWISVKDKLPKKQGFFLVVVDSGVASKTRGVVEIGDCYKTVDLESMKEVLKFQDYVTHWMPLPSPPAT